MSNNVISKNSTAEELLDALEEERDKWCYDDPDSWDSSSAMRDLLVDIVAMTRLTKRFNHQIDQNFGIPDAKRLITSLVIDAFKSVGVPFSKDGKILLPENGSIENEKLLRKAREETRRRYIELHNQMETDFIAAITQHHDTANAAHHDPDPVE